VTDERLMFMQSDVRLFFNNMADVWDSKEIRDEKWISNFITKYVPVSKGMRVLDIGCGTGIVSNILFEMSQTKVVGLDISESMIEIAKQNISFWILISILKISFQLQNQDLI